MNLLLEEGNHNLVDKQDLMILCDSQSCSIEEPSKGLSKVHDKSQDTGT